MKKLLIYNGNVPEESIRDFAEKAVFRVSLAELADENFNNDVYCDNELSKCCNEEYDINNYIDLCVINNSHYDISFVVYKILKDKYRYIKNNSWEYLDKNNNFLH